MENEEVNEKTVGEPTMASTEPVREVKFYYLIAGDVTYHLISEPDMEATTSHNAVISGSNQGLSPKDLYTAVEALKKVVLETFDNIEVDQATILNLIPLGFHNPKDWDEEVELNK